MPLSVQNLFSINEVVAVKVQNERISVVYFIRSHCIVVICCSDKMCIPTLIFLIITFFSFNFAGICCGLLSHSFFFLLGYQQWLPHFFCLVSSFNIQFQQHEVMSKSESYKKAKARSALHSWTRSGPGSRRDLHSPKETSTQPEPTNPTNVLFWW